MTRTGDREIRSVSGRLPDNPGELACMRHFPSASSYNKTFQSKFSLLHAFQANFKHISLIVSEMTENPTAKYVKFLFCATLLILIP